MRNKRRMFVLALAMSVILLLSGCVQIRVTITDTDSTETEETTDETLGTVVSTTSTEFYPVVAGAATVVYITVPADRVSTRTSVWGSLHSSTSTTYL